MAINGPIPTKEFVINQWAKITIERLDKSIMKNKVLYSSALINSLAYQIVSATGGDSNKVVLLYNYYGKFIDMGVGNGVPLSGKKAHSESTKLESYRSKYKPRKAKVWYSKTIYAEVLELADLMLSNFGERVQSTINEELPTTIKMQF